MSNAYSYSQAKYFSQLAHDALNDGEIQHHAQLLYEAFTVTHSNLVPWNEQAAMTRTHWGHAARIALSFAPRTLDGGVHPAFISTNQLSTLHSIESAGAYQLDALGELVGAAARAPGTTDVEYRESVRKKFSEVCAARVQHVHVKSFSDFDVTQVVEPYDAEGATLDVLTAIPALDDHEAVREFAASLDAEDAKADADEFDPTPDIKDLVNRFLSWQLPDSVCVDAVCGMPGDQLNIHRVGTNLLTAVEAEAMLRHVLKLPA